MCREVAVAYISKKYMSYRKTDPHDAELLQPVVAAVIRPTRENATNFCIQVIMYTCLKMMWKASLSVMDVKQKHLTTGIITKRGTIWQVA